MNLKQYIKMAFQNLILPVIYRAGCLRKAEPDLVVFADAHHDSRPDNMELVLEALKDSPCRIEEIYLDYQRNAPWTVLKSMARFMKLYARAGCVVICDNFLPAASCKKRPETRVVQLWHACGSLKRFGYDTADDIPAGYIGNVYKNTDLVTVSAPWCESRFASAMRLPPENVRALGVSRTDRYFDPAWREACRRKFREVHPEAAGKKVALWAPTFRGSASAPEVIPFDAPALEKALGGEWTVLVSTHPHMKDGKVMITTEEMFVSADCLIADYSSLIYEYLLAGQIMEDAGEKQAGEGRLVLYVPDFDEYSRKRGFYMPYEEIPAVSVRDFAQLAGAIGGSSGRVRENASSGAGHDESGSSGAGHGESGSSGAGHAESGSFGAGHAESGSFGAGHGEGGSSGARRREFLEKYMSACDGNSTRRIRDYILQKN